MKNKLWKQKWAAIFAMMFILSLMYIKTFSPEALEMVEKKTKTNQRCAMCTVPLAGHENTRFSIVTKRKKKIITCCARCGLFMLHKLKGRYERAQIRDWPSNKDIDAKTAFYVTGGGNIPCCVPSTISFAKRLEAEAFQKKYGGQIYTFDQTLQNIEKIIKKY
ncbi:MAG: hypothetical protein GY874_18250 [Desulfobacteraceae bacterium]|nr:hypothetical protein [Desulfobacteraceae bacterium]